MSLKIHSRYLNMDFETSSYIVSKDDNEDVNIISHDGLEDIIFNQMPVENGVKCKYDFIVSDIRHSVVCCTISDATGREINAIGESLSKTLITEIAQNHPTLIASQRAFDRAAVRYLGFSGKVFGTAEGVTKETLVDKPNKIETKSADTEELGKTIVNIGKYEGKNKTVAEIYKADVNWFNTIADKMLKSPDKDIQHQTDVMRLYKSQNN